MAKGYVAGFVRYDGRWVGDWVMVDRHRRPRLEVLAEASKELADKLALHACGPTVAGMKMVVVDGLCPDGGPFIEAIFSALREHDARGDR